MTAAYVIRESVPSAIEFRFPPKGSLPQGVVPAAILRIAVLCPYLDWAVSRTASRPRTLQLVSYRDGPPTRGFSADVQDRVQSAHPASFLAWSENALRCSVSPPAWSAARDKSTRRRVLMAVTVTLTYEPQSLDIEGIAGPPRVHGACRRKARRHINVMN
jgi:hypothetical protein